MDTKASYVTAGIFVIVLLIGLAGFILWISQIQWEKGTLYEVDYPGSITGLRQNEVVTYNGVPVGRVEEFCVNPAALSEVKVIVEIYKPEIIREDTIATLESKGITGSVQMRLFGSTVASPRLKAHNGQKYPVIKAQISSLQKAFEEAPKVLEGMTQLIDDIRPVFSKENVATLSDTLSNINKLAAELANEAPDLKGLFKTMQDAFSNLSTSGKSIDKAMNQFNGFIRENRPYIRQFTKSGLEDIRKATVQFTALSRDLDKLIQNIQPNPLQYFLRSTNQGEEYPE